MTKLDKQILTLTGAAKKQTDPVKRAKIADKIKQIRDKKIMAQWLGQ